MHGATSQMCCGASAVLQATRGIGAGTIGTQDELRVRVPVDCPQYNRVRGCDLVQEGRRCTGLCRQGSKHAGSRERESGRASSRAEQTHQRDESTERSEQFDDTAPRTAQRSVARAGAA